MGLRLTAGVAATTFARRAGRSLDATLDPARLHRLTDGGFLIRDAHGLRATPAGLKRLNAVIADLLA